jgi:hypothetical protein
MGDGSSFGDLHRLSELIVTEIPTSRMRKLGYAVDKLVRRLGPICVPLLGRHLAGEHAARRDVARAAFELLASTDTRARVIAELNDIADGDACDDGKLAAAGLLGELGERAAASFSDPSAIQRRSAHALVAQLTGPAEIAAAVELMLGELGEDELIQLVTAIAEASASAAASIAREIAARLDVELDVRVRIAELVPAGAQPALARRPRAATVTVLADGGARLVVLATQRVIGTRYWRRWAVAIAPHGHVEDAVYDADADDSAIGLEPLLDAGFRVASDDREHARALVAAAARRAAEAPRGLPAAYYLGRDLLELGDIHLGDRPRLGASPPLARALELLAFGDHRRASELLAACDANDADVAAALGACALADGQPAAALAPLANAAEAEPEWPLHHWNLAVAHHQLGDARACCRALRRFLTTSARPTGLYADVDQPSRVAYAHHLLAAHDRQARLATAPRARRRKRRKVIVEPARS